MKKGITCLALLLLALSLCIAALAEMPGSWTDADPAEGYLPQDAQDAFEKAAQKDTSNTYAPVVLMSKQLVAGTNYCILCRVTPAEQDAQAFWALVYVYADLQGDAEITNVYELYIARHWQPAEGDGQ